MVIEPGVDPDDTYNETPYEKGFAFVSYLCSLVGDTEKFDDFLKAYVAKFQFKVRMCLFVCIAFTFCFFSRFTLPPLSHFRLSVLSLSLPHPFSLSLFLSLSVCVCVCVCVSLSLSPLGKIFQVYFYLSVA